MKRLLVFLCLFAIPLLYLFTGDVAYSDELDDINNRLAELQKQLDDSKNATRPHEERLKFLSGELNAIDNQVAGIERELNAKRALIEQNYEKLDEQKKLFDETVREYYMSNYLFSPLAILASSADAATLTQYAAFQARSAEEDRSLITSLAVKLVSIEEQKRNLESEEKKLAGIKKTLDVERVGVAKIVGEAKDFQQVLSGQIAELSARQQEIINARSGGFTASIGDSELADDYNASIKGFRESAPSGYFGVFSFGAYTHRKGMSQYGARGRAQQGQSVNQILNAYYGREPVSRDTGGDIQVQGFGSMSFEDKYLLGIAEMPSSWHPEALKAQAIAARTYAIRYKDQGSAICTTEACQVYNDGKANNPPDAWRSAVQATRGQVLDGVVTYYASTHGGFADPIGWDTTDGSGGSSFVDKAWDKVGGSPWLYKAWYTKGYSISSDKCGRANPWLSPVEMADIVNAAIALKKGGIDTSRITPVTTSCWGGNPYSMDELRNLASGISQANSVNVSQGNGSTNSVTINGITLSGSEFKTAFNLRAPGHLSIPQSGFAFFNIEHK